MTASTSSTLRCVVGFDHVPKGQEEGRRFEPGDTVTKLPKGVVAQLREQGVICEEPTDA